MIYKKQLFHDLKFKFNNHETIEKNYSQAFQDLFVLTMTNGKKNGTFLEIGAFQAKYISNTYLLEKKFNWSGISIDVQDISKSFSEHSRSSKLIIQDALTIDYESLLQNNKFSYNIDYLQLDIDPALNTLECLKIIPFNKYKFSVITYETDIYRSSKEIRDESRNILKNYGYELIFSDVCFKNSDTPFEDWYIHPDLISEEILNKIKKTETSNIIPEKYFLNKRK
jgi:hypothetical protein